MLGQEIYDNDAARMLVYSVEVPVAAMVHMSPSSFHQHFKAVTSMSPLRFQKALRLQEARRLMLLTKLDVGSASRRVGFQSASPFAREYRRYSGSAPTKDMAMLRQQAGSPGLTSSA